MKPIKKMKAPKNMVGNLVKGVGSKGMKNAFGKGKTTNIDHAVKTFNKLKVKGISQLKHCKVINTQMSDGMWKHIVNSMAFYHPSIQFSFMEFVAGFASDTGQKIYCEIMEVDHQPFTGVSQSSAENLGAVTSDFLWKCLKEIVHEAPLAEWDKMKALADINNFALQQGDTNVTGISDMSRLGMF